MISKQKQLLSAINSVAEKALRETRDLTMTTMDSKTDEIMVVRLALEKIEHGLLIIGGLTNV